MRAMEGLKVLDLTHALAGPFCTYQLQLLGAEVIKIERPGSGDDFRDFGRPLDWPVGPSFAAVNGGKRSVTVNLKSPKGREIIHALARTADVVVENFKPGVADNLGIGWSALKALNPALVYCAISGFGQTGAMSAWPAYDHTIKAVAGMMWNGKNDDVPDQGRGFSVDCFSGYLAHAAILSALLRKERSGEGQFIDVSMLDASFVLMGVGLVRKLMTGDEDSVVQPITHDRPTVGPFRTTDGWLWLSVNFQHQFEILCEVIGADELLADERFRDVRARNANSAALKGILAEKLAGQSAYALEAALMERGCPAAKVRTASEALESPAVVKRKVLQDGATEDGKPVTLINYGVETDADGPALSGPIPALGADTDAVLTGVGYSAAEISSLREAGAI